MSRFLSISGAILTATYAIAVWLMIGDKLTNLNDLKLNEIGDFLAGIFGPVAILWLVLGYFQQGIELKQNTAALELQANELRLSVESQRELVSVARSQFDHEVQTAMVIEQRATDAIKPRLLYMGAKHTREGYTVEYYNAGSGAIKINFKSSGIDHKLSPDFFDRIEPGGRYSILIQQGIGSFIIKPFFITFEYIRSDGVKEKQKLNYDFDHTKLISV